MLKKLCRSAKDNGYTRLGFYPWVSGSVWVLYAFVLIGKEEAGKNRLQPPPPSAGMLCFTIYGGGLASAVRAAASLPLLTGI